MSESFEKSSLFQLDGQRTKPNQTNAKGDNLSAIVKRRAIGRANKRATERAIGSMEGGVAIEKMRTTRKNWLSDAILLHCAVEIERDKKMPV